MESTGSQRSLGKVAHQVLVDYDVVDRLIEPHSAGSRRATHHGCIPFRSVVADE
jgi:hypothetical protein